MIAAVPVAPGGSAVPLRDLQLGKARSMAARGPIAPIVLALLFAVAQAIATAAAADPFGAAGRTLLSATMARGVASEARLTPASAAADGPVAIQSAQDYRAARDVLPSLTGPLTGAAEALAAAHLHEQAVVLFSEALQRDPDVPHVLSARALSLAAMRRYDAAIADLTQAIALMTSRGSDDPTLSLAMLFARRGDLLSLTGRSREAADDLQRALEASGAMPAIPLRAFRRQP